jgi:hypothetical protein
VLRVILSVTAVAFRPMAVVQSQHDQRELVRSLLVERGTPAKPDAGKVV